MPTKDLIKNPLCRMQRQSFIEFNCYYCTEHGSCWREAHIRQDAVDERVCRDIEPVDGMTARCPKKKSMALFDRTNQ